MGEQGVCWSSSEHAGGHTQLLPCKREPREGEEEGAEGKEAEEARVQCEGRIPDHECDTHVPPAGARTVALPLRAAGELTESYVCGPAGDWRPRYFDVRVRG